MLIERISAEPLAALLVRPPYTAHEAGLGLEIDRDAVKRYTAP